jgi:transcriptional regulatory protein RtcR
MLLKAIEDRHFLPVGSDNEVQSDFQLIAGTNRDLAQDVVAGRFREDLYARINLWTYSLPSLRDRAEDIEPNLDYLLAQFGEENGQMVRFNREARGRFMRFARSPDALWSGNFRDLWASVTRMATLAQAGRITETIVDDEVTRLLRLWRPHAEQDRRETVALDGIIGAEAAGRLDLFDAMQLSAVIKVCRQSKSLSDAGRSLFGVSRAAKSKPNDADRLKKYLARFDLSWDQIAAVPD